MNLSREELKAAHRLADATEYWTGKYDPNKPPKSSVIHSDAVLVGKAVMRESDKLNVFPIFDILERLYNGGFTTRKQGDRWWLFTPDGEDVISGETFRELCVNIVMSGL